MYIATFKGVIYELVQSKELWSFSIVLRSLWMLFFFLLGFLGYSGWWWVGVANYNHAEEQTISWDREMVLI